VESRPIWQSLTAIYLASPERINLDTTSAKSGMTQFRVLRSERGCSVVLMLRDRRRERSTSGHH
jgi:hypothetical protein